MKKKIFALLLTLFLCPAIFAADYPWQLKKDKQGIQVSVRKVEGSSYLEYKARMVVNASLEKVTALYENEKKMPEWFDHCVESKLLEQKTPDEKILYFVINPPWPVSPRDAVYKRVRSQDAATGSVAYRISVLSGYSSETSGRIRMSSLQGLWRFTPVEGGTEVYYQQKGEPGGLIPAILANSLAVTIPYNSLQGFRKQLTNV